MDVYGFLFGRFAAGRRAYRQKCTVQTVGFISEVRRTGKVVQHVPQILILVNALDEEGNYFQTSLKRIYQRFGEDEVGVSNLSGSS